jgi:GDP-mannose 6-dehydrogenase
VIVSDSAAARKTRGAEHRRLANIFVRRVQGFESLKWWNAQSRSSAGRINPGLKVVVKSAELLDGARGASARLRIAVFGLGYVGAVSAACLARDGHEIVGVDPQDAKVALINKGRSPIVEKHVAEMILDAVTSGRLSATTSAQEAIAESDLALLCVGTPSRKNGSLDVSAIENVCREIGQALRNVQKPYTTVLRSTVLPGTMRSIVMPTLERESGRALGPGLRIANNPEFLRESTAVHDYDNPPKIVVGAPDEETANIVMSLYQGIEAPRFATSVDVAELVKYADNSWHALKVAFANEIGSIGKAIGVDSHDVMDIFCADEKLNISRAYLKPGFAFGGSCLPKDLRALIYRAKTLDVDTPLLTGIVHSNKRQIDRAFEMIVDGGRRNIAFLGISFKADTDDLRESPQVALVEQLLGKGYDVRIYDRSVRLAQLTGSNREYINEHIPHIGEILSDDLEETVGFGEVVVIGNRAGEFRRVPLLMKPPQRLVDLVRTPLPAEFECAYDGVNW